MPAPRIEAVLPTFLEFIGDAVDRRPQRALRPRLPRRRARPRRAGRGSPTASIDTVRRSPGAWCATRCPTAGSAPSPTASASPTGPSHRALDDALATADLLHVLLERAGALGVTGLDDLLALPTMAGHAAGGQAAAHRRACPARPASTCSATTRGGCSTSARPPTCAAGCRSYFSSDDRRKIGPLLRETDAHRPPRVRQRRSRPRCSRSASSTAPRPATTARAPRSAQLRLRASSPTSGSPACRRPRHAATAALYLGPLPSTGVARLVAEAIETAVPLRRCTRPLSPADPRGAPVHRRAARRGDLPVRRRRSTPARVRRPRRHRRARPHGASPSCCSSRCASACTTLAAAERFEEAADVRDRAAALAACPAPAAPPRRPAPRRAGAARGSGRGGVGLDAGRLVRVVRASRPPDELPLEAPTPRRRRRPSRSTLADELQCIAGWLDTRAARVRAAPLRRRVRRAVPGGRDLHGPRAGTVLTPPRHVADVQPSVRREEQP